MNFSLRNGSYDYANFEFLDQWEKNNKPPPPKKNNVERGTNNIFAITSIFLVENQYKILLQNIEKCFPNT